MKNFLPLLLLIFSNLTTHSQINRKVAILNMSVRNGDSGFSRTLSSIRLLTLAGVPFDTTSSLSVAMNYPIILTGTRIQSNVLTTNEITSIEDWVNNGGVMLTSSLREPLLYNLFGLTSSTSNNSLYELTWNNSINPSYFDLVDDSLEVTVSLGRSTSGPNFATRFYNLNTGTALAHYEDGTVAMVKNAFGTGFVYALGPDFRDVLSRNAVNQDLNAQRTYSNGFEPTTDVFVFVIRNIIRAHLPNTVYKYTAPFNYSSVVMITHDIDSDTSFDTLANFAVSENERGIVAHYNLSTNYVPGSWLTDLYIGTNPQAEFAQNLGHTLASHSVGHFPDFATDSIFPFGSLGNDSSNYQPFYNGMNSLNGTILGETEVSKNLIENDFNVHVKSWRSGHLAYPDSLVIALDTLGYEFNSTYSANDVLTGFPFYANRVQSFSSAQSKVLEIPMTISDVFTTDPISELNYMNKVEQWLDATIRYDRNNASTVLLIHPNRNYKLIAQESYLDALPATMKALAFEDFGSFWRKRDSLSFHSILQYDSLTIQMDSQYDSTLSFVIDTISLNSITFFDLNGLPINMNSQNYGTMQKLYFYAGPIMETGIAKLDNPLNFTIFPNPTGDLLNVSIPGNEGDFELVIYNINGQQVTDIQKVAGNFHTFNLSERNLQTGMYFIQVKSADKITSKRFVFIKK